MLSLKAKERKKTGKKAEELRKEGLLPGILYGPEIENKMIETDLSGFKKILKEAGESSLISLELEKDKFSVLIHEVKLDSLSSEPVHVDFYQPILTEETEATVPLVFEGEPLAVKELGGTLVREIQEVAVRALPEKLPHEIKVNVEKLKTFEDEILIKDLELPEGVKIEREKDEIVALVLPPEKVEEELEKPIEEKVEEVEEAEEKEEEEAPIEEEKKEEASQEKAPEKEEQAAQ